MAITAMGIIVIEYDQSSSTLDITVMSVHIRIQSNRVNI